VRKLLIVPAVLILSATPALAHDGGHGHADRVQVSEESDPKAIEIAQTVMEAMGGWEAWDATRYVSWNFFGNRRHWWDRQTGDIRIEHGDALILMNIHTKRGRAWEGGEEVTHADTLALRMDRSHKIWVNDSYWMFMPYKLLDPGVRLRYLGQRPHADGRMGRVLELTFDGVGLTPQNKYEVWVGLDSHLIEQWSFYRDAADEEAGFTMPWAGWKEFDGIWLATDHGREADWQISVHRTLPASVYTDPTPIDLARGLAPFMIEPEERR